MEINNYITPNRVYNKDEYSFETHPLFDNQPELLRTNDAAKILGLDVTTIYGWKHNAKMRKIPKTLFIKINNIVYLRTNVLRSWIISNNRR